MDEAVPLWPPTLPYATFRRRCKELDLRHELEAAGGTTRATLDTPSFRLTVQHRGSGGGYGGRRPIAVESVRVRAKAVGREAVIDGAPPKPRGFEVLEPADRDAVITLLRALFAPARGRHSPRDRALAKGVLARVATGEHAGTTGTVQWMGKRGKPELMVSLATADGRSFFLRAAEVEVIEGDGPRPMVKGARVKVVRGERAGELATLTWVDPEGQTDRVEVRFLPPGYGSLWLTTRDVELDV
ncbi:MAG: hypothetical protein EVA89_18800 [Sandaracinaceae bacterium]|nr:MAG: hypothetical protein EVA89_18800 [Sandaracinaceae bacterium]